MITVDNISLNAEHFGAMKKKEGVEAIVTHLKELEAAAVNVPKEKVVWALKVYELIKTKSPDK